MPTALLSLPDALRAELKEPWGPVFEDPERLLASAGSPLVTVGDAVTYHVERAGRRPDVYVVDGLTERSPVADPVRAAAGDPDRTVENPAATLTAELLSTLREAIESGDPVRVHVDGEEDLAALPAIVAAPDGASVVYGQPGEGMVLVSVTPGTRERAVAFLRAMEGDADAALSLLR